MSRLLLIDDEADVQYSFQRIFDTPEIELTTASSGEEALRIIPKLKPDLVLMDVRMSEVDGIQAAKQITAADPAARILIVTDYDDTELRHASMRAGACGYVLKDNLLELVPLLETIVQSGK